MRKSDRLSIAYQDVLGFFEVDRERDIVVGGQHSLQSQPSSHNCHIKIIGYGIAHSIQEDQLIYNTDLISLPADIVSAHVSNNIVSPVDVPSLINGVHAALAGLGKEPQAFEAELKPAVSVRSSIKPDYLICLEDGKKLKC